MPSLRVIRTAAALLCAAAAMAVPAAASAQAIERDVFVSVLNRSDDPVLNLGPADFIVREDGRAREVLRVRRATDPIALAILIDTSQAASVQITDLRQSLEAMVTRMQAQAHIALIGYGERPTVLADYTTDAAQLKAGIGRVFGISGSGAYTLEAITDTLKGLKKREAGRQAIVVLWVGGREFSNLHYDQVLEPLAAQGLALHVIAVSPGTPADAGTNEGRNRETVFDRGPARSGGRRQNILSPMALTDACTHLAAELLNQYRITYARPQTLIPPEKIVVTGRLAEWTLRATPVHDKDPAK